MSNSDTTTRDRILDAAEALFKHYGPSKTSMDDIATKAGLSRATLYLHFNGKRAVYESLLNRTNTKFVADIDSILLGKGIAPSKLRLITELTARTYHKNPVLFSAVVGDEKFSILPVAEKLVKENRGKILRAIQKIIKQGIKEKSLRKLNVEQSAYLIYELGNVLLIKELKGEGDYPLKKIITAMDELIARGILNNEPDPA